MRRWIALSLVLLALAAPVHAQGGDDEHADPGEKHERLEVYYNREFFNEPWRTNDEDKQVQKEAVGVSVACGVALGLLLKLRRSG